MTQAQTETETETKAKKKKPGKRNAVAGFIISEVDGDVMKAYIEDNALDIDVEGTDEQIAVALWGHFNETVTEEDKCSCDECEGVSTVNAETCPFCGDAGAVDEEDDKATNDEQLAAQALEEEPSTSEPEIEVEEEEDGDIEGTEGSPETEDEDNKPAAKAATKKTEKKNMETATNGASSKKNSKAMAKAGKSSLISAVDLDNAIADVEKLKGSAAESYWELGKKILEINEKSLWKLRVDDKGAAKYRGFDAFVQAELKMSPAHAYNAMECAQGYKTGAEVRELGHTKAVLILKAAPEDRPGLREQAKAGATTRKLGKAVAESRAKNGSPKKNSLKAKAGAKGAAAKAKVSAAKSEKVSVANIEGSKTIKLFKRPESLRALDFSTLPRAKRLGDLPFGKHELTNGVVQYFSVLEKDGELVLKIETRRETAEE